MENRIDILISIDIMSMGESMQKKNANVSHIAQNHAITRKHFGKLELSEIAGKRLREAEYAKHTV